MLRSTKELIGYKLAAKDGPIGSVNDFLFDEPHWTVRYMVADTGAWLPKHKVLISPISLGEPDWKSRLFPVRLTKSEIEQAPRLESDAPVSREFEARWFNQYGWPYYWGGASVWGGAAYPAALFAPPRAEGEAPPVESPEADTDLLRSVKEVTNYHIQAQDGDIGHVEEFILDDESWTLRDLVVDTRNWLPGRKVLVSPSWIETIEWAQRTVGVGLTREAVKDSPPYDPFAPVNREYEEGLYDYYGRPVYWR